MNALRFGQAVDPDEARRRAEQILADRRFRSDPAPRPLRGPLEWIGRRVEPVVEAIGDALSAVPGEVWLALGLVAVALAIAAIARAARRRRTAAGTPEGGPRRAGARDDEVDADALERAADEAERDGDLERALRLRFRAGLRRLGDRGAIAYRPSVTTGEVRAVLGSHTFDELARTFESVAYGGRAAAPPDVDAARREWPRVLAEAARR